MGELYVCADANFSAEDIPYNEYVIKKWNNVVKDNDIVLVLGKFVENFQTLKDVVPKLNGKIEFIDWNEEHILGDIPKEDLLAAGVRDLIYSNGWVKGEINGAAADVIIGINRKGIKNREDRFYFAAPESLTGIKDRYKNKILNLSIEYWGYAPLVYNQIPNLIDNCILFEKMENQEIDLNS